MQIKILLSIIWICSVCYGQVKYDYFTKDELEKDLALFSEKLTSIHPIFLDKTFENNWNNRFKALSAELKNSLTQNEFFLLVAPLLACLNDAHSNFLYPSRQRQQFMMSGGLSFPFSVSVNNNSILITDYFGQDSCQFKRGEEIISINGIASSEIIKEIRKLTGGNSKAVQNKTIEFYFRSYLWIIYHFEKDYELAIKNNSGRILNVFVKGVTNEQYIKHLKRNPTVTAQRYSLIMDVARKTSVFTIRSFADLNSFCAFCDSIFPLIAVNKIDNLIIDIRGNGGGRNIVVDSLMNYLTGKAYSQYQKIETRISNDLRKYYKEKYPDKFLEIKDYPIDELITSPGEEMIPHNKQFRFRGRVYLLTDGSTFSGAATFAGLFKEMKSGIVIGEETGGTIAYYGDFWYITLPNSGLQFHVSPKRFIQYGGTDLNRGVMPDILISDKNESVIEFTFSLIEKQ